MTFNKAIRDKTDLSKTTKVSAKGGGVSRAWVMTVSQMNRRVARLVTQIEGEDNGLEVTEAE